MTIDDLIKQHIERVTAPLIRRIEQLERGAEPTTGRLEDIAEILDVSLDRLRRDAKHLPRWRQGRAFHYRVEDWRAWFREQGEGW